MLETYTPTEIAQLSDKKLLTAYTRRVVADANKPLSEADLIIMDMMQDELLLRMA